MPLEHKVFKVAAEHIHDLPTHIVTSGWWGEVWWGGRVHAADTKHTHTEAEHTATIHRQELTQAAKEAWLGHRPVGSHLTVSRWRRAFPRRSRN